MDIVQQANGRSGCVCYNPVLLMSNGEQSAYPIHGGYPNDDPRNQIIGGGLTKREYFAAMAMQGLCANPNVDIGLGSLADQAVQQADELLKQLSK